MRSSHGVGVGSKTLRASRRFGRVAASGGDARARARRRRARCARLGFRARARAFQAWPSRASRTTCRRARRCAAPPRRGRASAWRAGWRSWKASSTATGQSARPRRALGGENRRARRATSAQSPLAGSRTRRRRIKRASGLVAKAYAKSRRIYAQSVFDQWCAFCEENETRKETLKRCVVSKRLLTSWFLAVLASLRGGRRRGWGSSPTPRSRSWAIRVRREPRRGPVRVPAVAVARVVARGDAAARRPAASSRARRGVTSAAKPRAGSRRPRRVRPRRPSSDAAGEPAETQLMSDEGGDSEDEIDRRVLSELGARR